jgi:uncharacterized membrane protein YhdT
MQTENVSTTCTYNTDGKGFYCITPAWFSGGDMFLSFLLLIILFVGIISLVIKSIFYIEIHKKYQKFTDDIAGKEDFKI